MVEGCHECNSQTLDGFLLVSWMPNIVYLLRLELYENLTKALIHPHQGLPNPPSANSYYRRNYGNHNVLLSLLHNAVVIRFADYGPFRSGSCICTRCVIKCVSWFTILMCAFGLFSSLAVFPVKSGNKEGVFGEVRWTRMKLKPDPYT